MDLILGLPVHPLIVHAAAVFIPLSAIGVVLVLFSERIRRTYKPLVLFIVAIAAGSAVLASSSGEALAERVGLPLDHSIQGERLRNVVLIFAILVALWYYLQRSKDNSFAKSHLFTTSLKGVITVVAGASLALTVVVGHSGATSAWKERIAAPASLTPDPNSAPSKQTGATIDLTAQEVAAHNNAADCWSLINGNVYNLTSFISRHPGGSRAVMSICGKDGSRAFTNQHGNQGNPNNTLKGFYLGALGSSITASQIK